jgi:hypothetical protein
VDAVEFEALVSRQEPAGLQRAADLYRGDLLDGLDVGAPPFEEWHTVELDPLQEVVHRALMRLYLGQGRRAAALRQYQECVQLLERELGSEPEELTRELYRKVLRGPGDSPAQPVPPGAARSLGHQPSTVTRGHFVGRTAALDALERSLETTLDGGGRVTLVSGEAGSGKTRLLEEFTAAATARGIRVALGRCYETEQPLPFRPWLDTLRVDGVTLAPELRDTMSELARAALVRLFPELGRPDERPAATTGDEHTVLFAALSELVQRFSREAPLIIALDDLHVSSRTSRAASGPCPSSSSAASARRKCRRRCWRRRWPSCARAVSSTRSSSPR